MFNVSRPDIATGLVRGLTIIHMDSWLYSVCFMWATFSWLQDRAMLCALVNAVMNLRIP